MNSKTIRGAILTILLIAFSNSGIVFAEGGANAWLAKENFSSTLTFTTDYIFRGVTFSGTGDSDGEPAIQGSFDWAYGPWFIGMWGSSQAPLDGATGGNGEDDQVASATLEIDYYFGWSDTVQGVDLTIFPLWYTYPGQKQFDDTTFELWTSAGKGFESLPGSPYVTLGFNWSDEFFDGGDNAYYYKANIAFTLPYDFGIDFTYGYQDVGGDGNGDTDVDGFGDGSRFFSDDYSHWEVGLTKSFKSFDFDVRYHDSDDDADFSDEDDGFDFDIAGSTVVLSISRTF